MLSSLMTKCGAGDLIENFKQDLGTFQLGLSCSLDLGGFANPSERPGNDVWLRPPIDRHPALYLSHRGLLYFREENAPIADIHHSIVVTADRNPMRGKGSSSLWLEELAFETGG
jgi:hypothetical protein